MNFVGKKLFLFILLRLILCLTGWSIYRKPDTGAPTPRRRGTGATRVLLLVILSALSVFGVNFFHLSYLLKLASSRWHQHMFATGGIASCLENLNSSGVTDKKKVSRKVHVCTALIFELKSIRISNWSNKNKFLINFLNVVLIDIWFTFPEDWQKI